VMVAGYLALIEVAKRVFFSEPDGWLPLTRRRGKSHELQRRASRFSYPGPRDVRA
jgi:Mg2+-importing ATPase